MKTKIDPKLHLRLLDIARKNDTTSSNIVNGLIRRYIELSKTRNVKRDTIKEFFSKYIVVDGVSSINSLDLYRMYECSELDEHEVLPRITFVKGLIKLVKEDNRISFLEREHAGAQSKFIGIKLVKLD